MIKFGMDQNRAKQRQTWRKRILRRWRETAGQVLDSRLVQAVSGFPSNGHSYLGDVIKGL